VCGPTLYVTRRHWERNKGHVIDGTEEDISQNGEEGKIERGGFERNYVLQRKDGIAGD